MSDTGANRRLADLLRDPREALDIEVKGWLDLMGSNDDKATLAKAMLALANHGGGYVLLGLTETDTGVVPALGRPPTLDAYSQDQVNGIVQGYADPPFHCAVHHEAGPDGGVHPIVVVPGGHRVPIRAKRDGPGKATVLMHAMYVRRPGPKSEIPQSAREWDELLGRCLAARRDDMLASIRDLLSGSVALPDTPAEGARLDEWVRRCVTRWGTLVSGLAADDPRRCPHGHYWMAYELRGDVRQVSLADFLGTLDRSVVRHTGWPPWWVPTRDGLAPYAMDGTVECWLGRDGDRETDPAHADFWRVSPDGLAFLLRGYQEDGPHVGGPRGIAPGSAFDLTLPVWRVGEGLLHAEQLAANLAAEGATVAFRVGYEGLRGRRLVSVTGLRNMSGRQVTQDDVIILERVVPAASISPNLVEVLHPLLEPLYALFGFFKLPISLVREELARMLSGRF